MSTVQYSKISPLVTKNIKLQIKFQVCPGRRCLRSPFLEPLTDPDFNKCSGSLSSIKNSVHVLKIPEKLSQEFAAVKSAISNIQESIRVLAESIGVSPQSSTLDNASTNVNNQSKQSAKNRPSNVNSSHSAIVKPISYVHSTKRELTSAVKIAVTETIKKQRMDDCGKASIVIYGLPNKGNDYENLLIPAKQYVM